MRINDRTVYDSDGNIVCRPLVALPPEDTVVEEMPTLIGIVAVLLLVVEDADEQDT